MNNQQLFNVGITLVPGIGDVLIKQLITYCGSAEAVFKESSAKLQKIPGIGAKVAKTVKDANTLQKAESIIQRAQKEDTQLIFFSDEKFPERLKNIDDSPCLLYYKGTSDLNNSKIISIVGTRKATGYGQEITQDIVKDLAPHNPIILSGLAYGIDIAAHKAAISHNLETIGVMASGLNIIYPSVHKKQASQMLEKGGLLTEFDFDEKPEMHNFPSRNRIIAGLGDATIVVEAAAKGGALITANIADSYNKDVFAVPGSIKGIYSTGCNLLIKNLKAHLYTSIDDIVRELQWDNKSPEARQLSIEAFNLNTQETQIAKVLSLSTCTIDELGRKTQLPINKLISDLLNLEFKGIVKALPGNKYQLIQ